MAIPAWDDPKLGTMKAAALWLLGVVGQGNTFTKADVAEAFPGVSQADRRVRELRKHGWKIDTNREDASLGQHEQRFVAPGKPVWEPGMASSTSSSSITEKRRREILIADGNMCRSCGVAGGEHYGDGLESAQIDIAQPACEADRRCREGRARGGMQPLSGGRPCDEGGLRPDRGRPVGAW